MLDDKIKIIKQKPTKEGLLAIEDINVSLQQKDFFIVEQFAGGQQAIALSASPLNVGATESSITFNETFKPSFESEFSLSLSQRIKGILPYYEVVDTDEYTETFQEFNIVASYVNSFGTTVTTGQSGTTLTICLDNPFDGQLGYWVDVYGLADSRFNYTNLNVGSISADKKVLTFTYSDENTLPSLTVNLASVVGGKLKCQSLGSNNFARLKFGGVSFTQAAVQTRFNIGKVKTSGIITTYGISPIGTSQNIVAGSTGNIEMKPTNRYKFFQNEDQFKFNDIPVDSNSADNQRITFTEVKPSFFKNYRNRMRMVNPISSPVFVGKIVSISKAGSNLMTIVFDRPHGLTTTSCIGIAGVRNIANFPNSVVNGIGNALTINSPTSISIPYGTSATDTQYGGFVYLANGQVTFQGLSAYSVQSVSVDSTGILTVINSTNYNIGIGEYVELIGCIKSDGLPLGVDGTYKVNNVNGTSLYLEPIKNLDGSYTLSGDGTQLSPTLGTLASTNCGGTTILRQTMRLYDIKTISYSPSMVRQENQGIGRDESLSNPVVLSGTGNYVAQGPAASLSTSLIGAWFTRPAIGAITDIAGGNITTTTTLSTITNDLGNAFQVTIPVTAIAGTNPTLDVRIEESFDGGTNWHTLYDFERITATGILKSPMLRANGRHIRYVQTVTGTTPSFARTIIRNVFPSHTADKIARLIDRTIVPTTLASSTPALFAGSASNVQMVINLGVTTTPPVLKLQGSEDGTNWYDLSATTLTGIAGGTAQLTLNNINAPYIKATVAIVGASVTLGYVAIKAWA